MEIALLAFHSIATLLFALAASLGFWVVTHQDEFGQSTDCPRLFMFIFVSAIVILGYLCFNVFAMCCASSTYALINLVCCVLCAHLFYLVFNIVGSVWVFSGPATNNAYLGNECDARVVKGVQYYLVGWWVYVTLFAFALCLTVSLSIGKAASAAAAVQSDLAREHEQKATLVAAHSKA